MTDGLPVATHSYRKMEKRRSCTARFLSALLGLAILGASAPVAALIGGQPDTENRYSYVVSLRIDPQRRCSATKIGARTFLTAAHCVVDIPTGGLAGPFQSGGRVQVSNLAQPSRDPDYQTLVVVETLLPPAFASALQRLYAYQQGLIADYRARYTGEDLARRIRVVHARSRITDRYPDAAIFRVGADTPTIPVASLDLEPVTAGAETTLVGYGCEQVANLNRRGTAELPVRRTWGRGQVIRVDEVNFFTFAGELRPGAPTLCPGDSGGPVLAGGRVVGVHGTVWGLSPRDTARSNMSVNLHALANWTAWPGPDRPGTPGNRTGLR